MGAVETFKKPKTAQGGAKGAGLVARTSKIFSPFRIIGHVSNGTPFATGTLGATFYVVTVVGRSFQIYDAATLHLLFVSSKQTPAPITATVAHFHYVYCAYGSTIGVFRRGRLEYEMELPEGERGVHKLVIFGNYLVAATDKAVHVFEKRELSDKFPSVYYASLEINSVYGAVVDIVHMPTYVNKIVVATAKHVMLYNIKTAKLVYTSQEFEETLTCVTPAPALDYLAAGTTDGKFKLYNLKKGRVLRTVNTGSNSLVTSVSFRTDGTPHAVASLRNGDLFFYDLNKNARVHVLANAHKEAFGGVAKAEFLNGQPIVVTTGADNSIKEFVFDPVLSDTNTSVVTPPRHLRSRGGHSAPPTAIIFGDEESHFIQSASQDRSFWQFSLRKDAQSSEISQREGRTRKDPKKAGLPDHYRAKLPPILSLARENARVGEWDNIVTAHQDEAFARTWHSKNKKIGKHRLPTVDGGFAKTVAMSQCGNFAFVGSSAGGIGAYNMQSGILRKKYMLHSKAVTGIAVDGMNRKMVSCGLDGLVGFYDFSGSKYLGKLQFDSPITQLVFHRSSDLFAVALDDLSIAVIDSVTQKVVRQLFGHTNRITAMDFSHDGRWIVSTALDSTIRTWDLPTGGCIDGIKLPKVATCLKISPNGEYLATAHVNDVGISLWTNKSQFLPISTRHIENESQFANILLPNVSGEGGSSMIEGALDSAPKDLEIEDGVYVSPSQLDKDLITLSHCARNKFNTLVHLESIKERNKPTEAPKKQENLPFFLELTGLKVGNGAIEGELGKDVVAKMNERQSESTEGSRLLKLDQSKQYNFETEFTKLLRTSQYDAFIDLIVDMSPAALDFEVKSLSVTPPYAEIVSVLKAIQYALDQNKNVEIVIAFTHMFLKNHADVLYNIKKLSKDPEAMDLDDVEQVLSTLTDFKSVNSQKVLGLDSITKYCSSVVTFIATN